MTKFQQIINGQVVSLSNGHMPSYFTGLDASKPSNPGKGDFYVATDTSKQYTCYSSGNWTCTYSPCRERYLNHDGNITNFITAQNNMTGGGVIQFTTPNFIELGTSASGTGNVLWTTSDALITLDPILPIILNFKMGTLSAGTAGGGSSVYSYYGLNKNFTQILVVGQSQVCFLQKTNGSWVCNTAESAGLAVTETVITAPVQNDILTIMATSKNVIFFINGAVVATHTTNLPQTTTSLYAGVSTVVTVSAMSVARTIGFAAFEMEFLV